MSSTAGEQYITYNIYIKDKKVKKKRINKAKGAIKTKRSFQEKFGLSEEGIVGIWDFITKLLSFISILEIIIFIWKKIINYNRDKYNTLVHDMNKR